MEFVGKVLWKSDKISAGTTEKVDVHLQEDKSEHPNSIVLTFFGDQKVWLTDDVDVGDTVGIAYNTKVSEYNGRKFTNLNAWKITSIDKTVKEEKPVQDGWDFDDLPF